MAFLLRIVNVLTDSCLTITWCHIDTVVLFRFQLSILRYRNHWGSWCSGQSLASLCEAHGEGKKREEKAPGLCVLTPILQSFFLIYWF